MQNIVLAFFNICSICWRHVVRKKRVVDKVGIVYTSCCEW